MTGGFLDIDIRGRAGLELREKWAAGPRTYLGLTVAGFPNLFLVTGPGSPGVLSNMVVSIEQHVDWLAGCIAHLRAEGLDVVEATPDAEEAWVRHVNEIASRDALPAGNLLVRGRERAGKAASLHAVRRRLRPLPGRVRRDRRGRLQRLPVEPGAAPNHDRANRRWVMPLKGYGVLRGKAIDRRREGSSDTPHFQIRVADGAGVDFRIAVNVKSQSVAVGAALPARGRLPASGHGRARDPRAGLARRSPHRPGDVSLDYIRGNLFDPALMRAAARRTPPGPTTISPTCSTATSTRAIGDPSADLYAFGQRWGPEDGVPDKVFGFAPGNGVHDIHMNQGNDPAFARDDGVWQDGGLLVHFPAVSRWVGDLPRVPEPGVAHRRHDRPRDRGRLPRRRPHLTRRPRRTRRQLSASSARW